MIIFGKQCFEYVLLYAPKQIQEVYLSKEIHNTLFKTIQKLHIPIVRIDNKKAQSLAKGHNHQGMFAKIYDISLTPLNILLESQSILALCGLTDIGNIGSIVRSAYALGIQGIVLCERQEITTAVLEGIFRTSSGSLLHMPLGFCESSLDFVNQAKMRGFTLLGTGTAPNHTTQTYNLNKWALFIGKEDTGLTHKLLSKMDSILHIQMQHDFNSLNVSVATGILIDRIQHQRQYDKGIL